MLNPTTLLSYAQVEELLAKVEQSRVEIMFENLMRYVKLIKLGGFT